MAKSTKVEKNSAYKSDLKGIKYVMRNAMV